MSKQRQKEAAELHARWKEFRDDHKNFDSSWARNILHNLSEFLPLVFKFNAVSNCLKELYGARVLADFDWSSEWTNVAHQLPAAALGELPIFKLALALRAYAF